MTSFGAGAVSHQKSYRPMRCRALACATVDCHLPSPTLNSFNSRRPSSSRLHRRDNQFAFCLNAKSWRSEVLQEAELSGQADSENNLGGSSQKTISYCVKDAAGRVQKEGEIGSTRRDLDCWIRILPQPRTIAMEATIFTGWIYDHLLPHAEKVKVAHPLMSERSLQPRRRTTRSMPARSLTACGATSSARVTWPRRRSETGAERCATGTW
jgi:hypothetical protein